jgi:hypothetical protein
MHEPLASRRVAPEGGCVLSPWNLHPPSSLLAALFFPSHLARPSHLCDRYGVVFQQALDSGPLQRAKGDSDWLLLVLDLVEDRALLVSRDHGCEGAIWRSSPKVVSTGEATFQIETGRGIRALAKVAAFRAASVHLSCGAI